MSLSDYLKCPGLDRVANAVPEMRLCHKCGSDVEIWTDEKKGRCSKCGTMIKNRNLQPGDEKKSESCLQKAEPDLNLKELVRLARSLGASDAQIISSGAVVVENDLANLCREPQCENYGLSLSCPPHVSGPSGFAELTNGIFFDNFHHRSKRFSAINAKQFACFD